MLPDPHAARATLHLQAHFCTVIAAMFSEHHYVIGGDAKNLVDAVWDRCVLGQYLVHAEAPFRYDTQRYGLAYTG